MGKSDYLIFQDYLSTIEECNNDSVNDVAFLGFSSENELTKRIFGKTRHFYDKSLGNWDINTAISLSQKYDLIVCTRCAYFCKEPDILYKECQEKLKEGGHALIDWGLGDHWRFDKYKVGWLREGEQEHAYEPGNFLHSCFWDENLIQDEQVNIFWEKILLMKDSPYNKGDFLPDIIKREVPKLISYETKIIKTRFLWPGRPQLYIITLIEKSKNVKR
jgi:SAM-dependent methyltransferase